MHPYELAQAIAKGRLENGGADTKGTIEWAEELGDLVDPEEAKRLIGQATAEVEAAARSTAG